MPIKLIPVVHLVNENALLHIDVCIVVWNLIKAVVTDKAMLGLGGGLRMIFMLSLRAS